MPTAPLCTTEEILAARRCIEAVDEVRALRTQLGLSQEAFAARFGFTVCAIRQYVESRRRTPTGPARTLLRVIAHEPNAATRPLAGRPITARVFSGRKAGRGRRRGRPPDAFAGHLPAMVGCPNTLTGESRHSL
jgi:DNA-binding transcriptional regulator YiaG